MPEFILNSLVSETSLFGAMPHFDATMKPITYLPHLDGLRAVALIGVLLFHFQVPHFNGGFAGVDVFLSLSGFLITRNITRDLTNHTFSLRRFYIRRFYRLYPASVVIVALSLILALLTFPSPLAKSVAASGLASMQFVANIFFHAQANYFDADAITKPLLHMWSLSLEEQYYLLWAPTLCIVYRSTNGIKPVSVILFILFSTSLALGVTLYPSIPSAVFFELPARIFQFAAGALVALGEGAYNPVMDAWGKHWEPDENAQPYKPVPVDNDIDNSESSEPSENDTRVLAKDPAPEQFQCPSTCLRLAKEILALFSVCVLCLSYILLSPNASPLQMLPTTFSTCLIIMLPDTVLSRYFFSNGLLQFIGRISYSAYLVHWPMWVFTTHTMRALHIGAPNSIVMAIVTAVSATLLRNTVETPFRHGSYKVILAVITGLTGLVAAIGVATDGFSFRFGNVDFDLSNKHQAEKLFAFCRDESGAQSELLPGFHVKTCRVGDLNGTRSKYVFFGDSFTLHLAGALDGVGRRRKEWYGLHFQSGCNFLPHSARSSIKPTRFHCQERHDELWNELKTLENGSIVAVANSWGNGKRAELTFPSLVADINAVGYRTAMVAEPPGMARQEQEYFDCADFAVMPISRLWQVLRKGTFEGAKECASLDDGLRPDKNRPEQATAYRELAKRLRAVELIEIFNQLCSQNEGIWRCRVPILEKTVYDIGYRRDRRHLTRQGSEALSEVYEHAIFAKNRTIR